jgi:anti-sigma factor RsiW
MSAPNELSASEREHHLEWNDRLQDWLDGATDAAETATLQTHLDGCALCRARVDELVELDRSLRSTAPRLSLDESFDARIFAQIDAIDVTERAEARHRIERELQQNLNALARGWRRALLFVIPGIVAGIALAFGLNAWLEAAGFTRMLVVETAAEFGRDTTGMVHMTLTALLGAGLGATIAGWLASVVE